MKNSRRWIIIGLVVLVVLAFMTTYTVKFTEKAIVTTFGASAKEPIDKPGLQFTVPYVQQVIKYDTRARYLESKPETQQTLDSRQLVVTAYVAWRVSDPNRFFQKFSAKGDKAANHYKGAEQLLADKLRHALGEISKFSFGELLSTSAGSKLEACEKNILARMVHQGAGDQETMMAEFGIEPISVGLVGIELPENMTNEVFTRMQQERATLANKAKSEGKAIAETIRQSAGKSAEKILAFANQRAELIRAEGDRERTEFLRELAKEPDLAIFLRNLELMRSAFASNKATLVIPAGPMGGWTGMELFNPAAGAGLNSGWMPNWDFRTVKTGAPGNAPAEPAPKRTGSNDAGDRDANRKGDGQ